MPGRPSHVRRTLVFREYQELTGLCADERRDLERFALEQPTDGQHTRRIIALRNGRLHAQNCVGIIETHRGTVIEILPKMDLSQAGTDSPADQHNETRSIFLRMLRDWRGLGYAQIDATGIRATRHFDMLEAFVHLFLTSVVRLTQRGLARAYRSREANLPCLRGRILFAPHVRENLVNRSRFYVGYGEFTADRPANRLIHLTLRRLAGVARQPMNRQRIRQLEMAFTQVPPSTNVDDDWARHRVDRSMGHYDQVMSWVGLFLFRYGLATFADRHVNRALLIPMEEVFEDFVTAAVRRYQQQFTVFAQGPKRYLAKDNSDKDVFRIMPDVGLSAQGEIQFVLDAKWKRIDPVRRNYGVSQGDVYQLFAYGRKFRCRRVVLIYPRTTAFRETLEFRFLDSRDLRMACFPFDVADPEGAIRALMQSLLH